MHKHDLALYNLPMLVCHKTEPAKQPTSQSSKLKFTKKIKAKYFKRFEMEG